ncbi:MAG: hypothetical protein ACO2OV_00715 [Thermoproteota archaeon]|jgi:hypothetical protein
MFKKKIEATFGNDYAIEKAEEELKKHNFHFKRKIPLKLEIFVTNKKDIEKITKIVRENLGYVEEIETFKKKIIKTITYPFKALLLPKKKK